MTVPIAAGQEPVPGADGAGTGGGAAGGAANNNQKKQKDKMECGESGTYGDLKKKTGQGMFDRDHVPSKAALKERARALNGGGALCDAQKKAVDSIGNAIAIPKGVHSEHSPTYGGRNTEARVGSDAGNLQGAAQRDTAAVSQGMKDPCKKKYDGWADKIKKMTNADYDKMLGKAIAVGK